MTPLLSRGLVVFFAAASLGMTERATLPPQFLIAQQECPADCPCAEPNDPDIRVSLFGGTPTGYSGNYSAADITDLDYPSALVTDIGTMIGTGTQGGVQRMVLEFDPVTVRPGTTRARAHLEAPPRWRQLLDLLQGPVLHAQASSGALTLMLTANGNSQGLAFDLKIVNSGATPMRFNGDGLIVEPLRKEAAQAAQRELTRLARGSTTVQINGYCLDQPLAVPSAGMLFRLAPANVQKQFAGMARVLRSARRLNAQGLLHPDSNRRAYLDFIKQWSVWTDREKWNERAFADAFVEHTRKQVTGSGRAWNAEFEKTVRGAAPNRWRDIAAVLAAAAR